MALSAQSKVTHSSLPETTPVLYKIEFEVNQQLTEQEPSLNFKGVTISTCDFTV